MTASRRGHRALRKAGNRAGAARDFIRRWRFSTISKLQHMNKVFLGFLVMILSAVFGNAATFTGKVAAVDERAGTVIVVAKELPTLFRFRPSVEVIVNGQRGKMSDLVPGITVVITSMEPSVANRITATIPLP